MTNLKRLVVILSFIAMIAIIAPIASCESEDFLWCGKQDIFFWNESSDLIKDGSYKIIDHIPEKADESLVQAVDIVPASGEVLLAAFITPDGSPGVTMIAPGLWRSRAYFNTTSAVGLTHIEFKIYNRSATGVETKLFYKPFITQDIDNSVSTEFLTSYARRNATTLFDGDRIVIKIYASSSNLPARTVSMVVGGNLRASMIESGWYICPANGGDDGASPQILTVQETPLSPFVIGFAVAIAMFIVSVRKRE